MASRRRAISAPLSPLVKAGETARPGYYAVTLADPGVRVEIAATPHGAVYRFTAGEKPFRLLIDGEWQLTVPFHKYRHWHGEIAKVGERSLTAWRETSGWNFAGPVPRVIIFMGAKSRKNHHI